MWLDRFHDIYIEAFHKYSKHMDSLPARNVYKQVRVLDPRQASAYSKDLDNCCISLGQDKDDTREQALDEWVIYMGDLQSSQDFAFKNTEELVGFWKGNALRLPLLSAKALQYIFFPVTSADAERSFSLYKHTSGNRRESLSEKHVRELVILNYNGDLTSSLLKPRI